MIPNSGAYAFGAPSNQGAHQAQPFAGNLLPPIALPHGMPGAERHAQNSAQQLLMAHQTMFQPGLQWLSTLSSAPPFTQAFSQPGQVPFQHHSALAQAPFPLHPMPQRVEYRQELGVPGLAGVGQSNRCQFYNKVDEPFQHLAQASFAQSFQNATPEQLLQVLGAMSAQALPGTAKPSPIYPQFGNSQLQSPAQAHALHAENQWAQAAHSKDRQADRPAADNVVVTVMGRRKLRKNDKGEIEEHKRDDINITKRDLKALYGLQLRVAADRLGISHTAFKTACRKAGITKWPYRKFQGFKNLGIDMADVSDDLLSMSLESAKMKLAQVSGVAKKRAARRSSSGSGSPGGRHVMLEREVSTTRTDSEPSSTGGGVSVTEDDDDAE